MAIFAVMGLGDTTALKASIEEKLPRDNYSLDDDKWLVSAKGETAKEVAEKLGMQKKGTGARGIVITVGGYNGLAPADIWEWMKAKSGENA